MLLFLRHAAKSSVLRLHQNRRPTSRTDRRQIKDANSRGPLQFVPIAIKSIQGSAFFPVEKLHSLDPPEKHRGRFVIFPHRQNSSSLSGSFFPALLRSATLRQQLSICSELGRFQLNRNDVVFNFSSFNCNSIMRRC